MLNKFQSVSLSLALSLSCGFTADRLPNSPFYVENWNGIITIHS